MSVAHAHRDWTRRSGGEVSGALSCLWLSQMIPVLTCVQTIQGHAVGLGFIQSMARHSKWMPTGIYESGCSIQEIRCKRKEIVGWFMEAMPTCHCGGGLPHHIMICTESPDVRCWISRSSVELPRGYPQSSPPSLWLFLLAIDGIEFSSTDCHISRVSQSPIWLGKRWT